jgi:predicted enzyme related to lactoylglutathione lyase
MKRFFHYTLRTTDVPRARAFYSAVLGEDHADIVQLHEQALARGARPHWLGFIDCGDVDASVSVFGARGAAPLGPKWVNPRGLEAAVLRDPGGALVALAKPGHTSVPHPEVAWHQLNTADVEHAKANYAELLGWAFQEPLDLGVHGVFHPFAWEPGGPAVGSMADVSRRPGIHPHWLFHFRVSSVDAALEAVRAHGGLVVDPVTLANGDRIAVCDDAQGAAFTLREDGAR